jgi:hypothetical protein
MNKFQAVIFELMLEENELMDRKMRAMANNDKETYDSIVKELEEIADIKEILREQYMNN